MASISAMIPQRQIMTTADTTTSGSANSQSSSTDAVSKDQFLKLLVAQLQNQDPLNPLQGEAFVAQLATFSSLEQLVSINDNIKKLVGAADSLPASGSTQA